MVVIFVFSARSAISAVNTLQNSRTAFAFCTAGIVRSFASTSSVTTPIHVDHRDRFARLLGIFLGAAPAQREVGNVDRFFPQDRSHFPDHARHVAIAQVNQVALQRRFHVDAIHMQQPRRVPMQHRAFHHVLFRGALQKNRQHAARASGRRFRLCAIPAPAARAPPQSWPRSPDSPFPPAPRSECP